MVALTVSAFDTLDYVKKLKAANVPEQQAEAQAQALRSVLEAVLVEHAAGLATKGDIELLRKEIALARRDTVIWLGGMLVVGFGLVLRYLSKLPI